MESKRWAAILAAGVFGGALAWAGGSGPANSLTLVNGGRTYAALDAGTGQASKLKFFDRQGHAMLEIGVEGDGLPQIRLLSAKGQPKLTLKVMGTNQSGTIAFQDSKGKERMRLGLDPSDASEDPYLFWVDKTGARHPVFGK
jgi:hypothetical protein